MYGLGHGLAFLFAFFALRCITISKTSLARRDVWDYLSLCLQLPSIVASLLLYSSPGCTLTYTAVI